MIEHAHMKEGHLIQLTLNTELLNYDLNFLRLQSNHLNLLSSKYLFLKNK